MFRHDIAIWNLRVLHQSSTPVSIHIHRDVAAIVPGQTKLSYEPIRSLLALNGSVIKRAISRRVDFVERCGAKELIIIRHLAVVMTLAADRRIKLLMIWAPRIT